MLSYKTPYKGLILSPFFIAKKLIMCYSLLLGGIMEKRVIQIGSSTNHSSFKELEVALFSNDTLHIIPFNSKHRAIFQNKFTLLDTIDQFLEDKKDFLEYYEDCSFGATRGSIIFKIRQKMYTISLEDVKEIKRFLEDE